MPANSSRFTQYVFVVFSDDWGRHPSSCQHLFRRIVPYTQVVWVNTIGLRTPRLGLYDIRRAIQVICVWLHPGSRPKACLDSTSAEIGPNPGSTQSAEQNEALHVLCPPMWPSFRQPRLSVLNQQLLSRAVHKALRRVAPGKQPILVSTVPIVPNLFRDRVFKRTVYYCVDDFTLWHGVDGQAMRRLERQTLQACDLLIAASISVLKARSASVGASMLLTHGVDVKHFRGAAPNPVSPLATLRHPIVGMFGLFDRRIDGEVLAAAARRSPQATFVVIGPVIDRDLEEFRSLSNLRFLGSIPYAELPGHVAHFDLCILPYVVDETTRNLAPLKLKEYLATGKPIVATPLPEAVRLAEHLILAASDNFPHAVASALADMGSGTRAVRSDMLPELETFLESESWEIKAEQFLREITKGL